MLQATLFCALSCIALVSAVCNPGDTFDAANGARCDLSGGDISQSGESGFAPGATVASLRAQNGELHFSGDAFVFKGTSVTIPGTINEMQNSNAVQDDTIASQSDSIAEHTKAIAEQTVTIDNLGTELHAELGKLSTAIENGLTNANAAIVAVTESVNTEVKASLATISTEVAGVTTAVEENAAADAATKELLELVYGTVVGSLVTLPAADCAAMKKARPTAISGKYWIESSLQSAAVNVWCEVSGATMKSLGGDGKTKATAAASCDDNSPWGTTTLKRWIDPDADANNPSNAVQKTCPTDLLIKIHTTDGHTADWRNTNFWESTTARYASKSEEWLTYGQDIKTATYSNTAVGKQIEVVAIKDNKVIGRAVYDILEKYQSKTLRYLVHQIGGQNHLIGKYNAKMSSDDQPIYSNYMDQRGGNRGQKPYDMFVDTAGDLMSRRRNYGSSQDSWNRLSTSDKSGDGGGHVYGGFGGDHYQSGWRIQFEAAPISGYCSSYNFYGKKNGGWRSYRGGATPYHNCGGPKRRSDIHFAIRKNPPPSY